MSYTYTATKAWLHMLREGGLWTVPELVTVCGLQRDTFRNHLARWTEAGCAVKRGTKFGVTPACKIPHGITLAELQDALAANAAGENALVGDDQVIADVEVGA